MCREERERKLEVDKGGKKRTLKIGLAASRLLRPMLCQISTNLGREVRALTCQIIITAPGGFAGVRENLDLREGMLACLLAGSECLGRWTTDSAFWDCRPWILGADERDQSGEAESG